MIYSIFKHIAKHALSLRFTGSNIFRKIIEYIAHIYREFCVNLPVQGAFS